ncbi:MAG TPA: alpha/beta fold hydrolase [Gemmatimonadales bacterium]|nr:alpha/beta fold hydrolase [Gemmatimonadales bacterium]
MRLRIPAVLEGLRPGRREAESRARPLEPAGATVRGELTGRRVGHFEIGPELGRGGMGVVYQVRDGRLDRRVAVKAIHAGVALNAAARRRFGFEARAAARLRHPYICQVYDLLEIGGEELIVMELLEGESLETRLARGALPVADAVRLAGEAAEALREAHAHGIVHRDIKPSNLWLSRSGHVKLMDFGVARLMDAVGPVTEPARRRGRAGLTEFGSVVGTVGYMAPEQASGAAADERSDIFALGVVLFEMLCGTHPFSASGLVPYLNRLLSEAAAPVSRHRPEVGPGLADLVAQMLASEPSARPRDMGEVHRRLVSAGSAPPAAVSAPQTRYARSGEVSVAYQVFGDGPVDVVYVPGWVTHLEVGWQQPRVAGFLRRLASFSRVIVLDKRGTGLSDRAAGYPTLEDRMDDLRAVMDAVGSERAVLFGMSEGGNMAALFAATYPERTRALVTFGVFAKRLRSSDYPWAPTREAREVWFRRLAEEWGGPVDLELLAPSLAEDAAFAEWWAAYLRLGASPGAAVELGRCNSEIDVRAVLRSIDVPALVMHRTGDRDVMLEEGRYIASLIPGAEWRELLGDDHLIYAGDAGEVLAQVERFVAGLPDAAAPRRRWRTVVSVYAPGPHSRAAAAALLPRLMREHGGLERGSTLDHLRAAFGGPVRALRFGRAVVTAARRLGVPVGVGVAAGPCDPVPGMPAGLTASIADELASRAGGYEVRVMEQVRALAAGGGHVFEARGEYGSAAAGGPMAAFVLAAD